MGRSSVRMSNASAVAEAKKLAKGDYNKRVGNQDLQMQT